MRDCAAVLLVLMLAGSLTAGEGLKDSAPNTWVRVADGPGPRRSFGLVYSPAERAFVCLGGSMMMDPKMDPKAVESPYSEMTLNLEKGVWENRFPKGKENWGEPVGPAKAPPFPGSYYAFKWTDAEGNVRPYLGAGYYNAMWLWGNWAHDVDRGRVVTYWTLAHQMAEYDAAARTWHPTTMPEDLPQEFRDGMLFGAMCYDPVNREVLGGQGRWAYKDGAWGKIEFGGRGILDRLAAEAEALHRRARNLAGACRARYYLAETEDEAKVGLRELAWKLADEVGFFISLVKSSIEVRHEFLPLVGAIGAIRQAEPAQAALAQAVKLLAPAAAGVKPEAIHAVESGAESLWRAAGLLSAAPPKRAHSRMVFDEASRKIVLFGGDALDRLLGDTWVYDPSSRYWEPRDQKLSPSPRAGHKLVWLPRAKKVLLIGGYGCKGSSELWVYDTKAASWQLLAADASAVGPAPATDWYPTPAAADENDVVVTCLRDAKGELATFAVRIDASRIDAEGTARLGVGPLTESPYPNFRSDPQWYDNNSPPPDPAAEEKFLNDLPANTWVMRQSPNWPKIEYAISRCWGTAAFDTDRDQILHFGGGHGTYDGNDVLHYSVRANRYYIGRRPEHTLNFAPNGIGIPACRSYQGRPFMSCHTYKAYGYCPALKKMVFVGTKTEDRMFTYNPDAGDWELNLLTPFHRNEFTLKYWSQAACAPTPKGMVLWTGAELWRVDAARATWEKLPVQGKLPGQGWDVHGLAYDSKRDRLLLFSAGLKGDVVACDVGTGQTALLGPAGRDGAAAPCRETAYIPEADVVLVAARPAASPDAKPRWLVYDCARNAWLAAAFAGADPIGKERFNVSLGLMHDPRRKLVWTMDILSRPAVLRLDRATADLLPLSAGPPASQPGQR